MGISCSDERDKYNGYSFTSKELEAMKNIFNHISKTKPKSESRKTLSKMGLKKHLPENQEFALKLYHWMRAHSDKDAIIFDTYVTLMQVLVKDLSTYHSVAYRNTTLEKFEIFLQISVGKYLQDQTALQTSIVSFSQALIFFQEIFNIFNSGKTHSEPNSLSAKLLVNSVFKNDQTTISWKEFVRYVKEKLPNLNNVIRDYFSSKFVNPEVSIKTPTITPASNINILTPDLISIFSLTDSTFYSLPKASLIYSTDTSGKNFHSLAKAIKSNHTPTLIIIKHTETGKDGQVKSDQASYVCGAFIKAPYKSNIRYSSNSETVLFSLIPRFRIFEATNAKDNKNFVYLNTDASSRVGLGFGGVDYKGFKLWIDEKLDTESYTNDKDGTYENGSLLEPYITKLNIASIEVWSVEGEYRSSQIATQEPVQAIELDSARMGSYTVERSYVVESSYVVDKVGTTEYEKQGYYSDPYYSPGKGSYRSSSPTRGSEFGYTPTNHVTVTTSNYVSHI